MKDNSGKIILALLAGASAGVVAGILMAPDTGEVSRGNLKKSASKLGQDLESKLQASMEQLQALTASAGSLLGKVSGSGNGGADVVNTGSNTTATSHLNNVSNGGNDGAASGNTTGGTTGKSKGKKSASSGSGDSTGSGGGSNATA